jgi:uncharacterized protein (TIGR02217 family)
VTFVDMRLSRKVSTGFEGGPMWNTRVVSMANGSDRRNAEWSMPHYKFTADYTLLDPVSQNEILNAFLALRGQKDSCRFKDWNDYRVINDTIGVGDGTTNPLQLIKNYTFGSATYSRAILLPIANTLVVTSNGTPKTVTVNDQTGLITPSTAWASGAVIKATCEFDVRVRFGADYYPFSMPARHIAQVSIDLVEAVTP